jgi:hypothetical protein
MATIAISALPVATAAATTDVLPIVQGGTTKQVTNALLFTNSTLVTPALGTPTSGTLTNCTGLPVATGISNLGTGVATFLATPSSANLRTALTDETGTGSAVFATAPTISNLTVSGTSGNVFSNTYTPTQLSTNTNVDSVTFSACQHLQVGNTVTVSGQLVIDATTATTDTIVRMSLPVATVFSSTRQLGGVGASATTPFAANSLVCVADTANNGVEVRLRPSVDTALAYNFSFTYQVI